MHKITRQQALERWEALPDSLKEAIFSESNTSIVWQIGVFNHLPEEKISTMAMIVGDVILGFIHSVDLAKEISESLNINIEIANSIAREIDRKIFLPVKPDLEKNYSPVVELPEIKKTDEVKNEKVSGPKSAEITKPVPVDEIIKKAVPITSAPATIIPKVETTTAVPAPISSEKPFILHQETEVKQVAPKAKTTTAAPSIGWFSFGKKTTSTPQSPVKVELETFGQKIEEKKQPVMAKTEIPKQRVVHYREVETPSTFGKAPQPQNQPVNNTFGQIQPASQLPKENPISNYVKPPFEITSRPSYPKNETPKPFNAVQDKALNQNRTIDAVQNKPLAQQEQSKPFGQIQNNQVAEPIFKITETPKPQARPEPTAKPFDVNQNKTINSIPSNNAQNNSFAPTQSQSTQPKIVNFDSSEQPEKKESGVKLEGNVIDLSKK